MNWLKELFGFGDKMETDYNGLPKVTCNIRMPKVKATKGNDISEPVLGIIRAFKQNPKRFKFIDDGHPKPDYFRFDRYAGETTGNYFAVVDMVTGEKFLCSVSGLGCLSIKESITFISCCGNLGALGLSLKKANNLIGGVHNEWLTNDESELLVDIIGSYQKQRIIKATEWCENKASKEERLAKIKKAMGLVSERNRLKEIYCDSKATNTNT